MMAVCRNPTVATTSTTCQIRNNLDARCRSGLATPPLQRLQTCDAVSVLMNGQNGDRLSYIQFLGAAGVVTGSKHLINTAADETSGKGFQALVDCGLFQGQKEWRERNWQDLPIPAREIDAVILTHAHLDHSGWIPRLVKQS